MCVRSVVGLACPQSWLAPSMPADSCPHGCDGSCPHGCDDDCPHGSSGRGGVGTDCLQLAQPWGYGGSAGDNRCSSTMRTDYAGDSRCVPKTTGDSGCAMSNNYIGDNRCGMKTNHVGDGGCPTKLKHANDSGCSIKTAYVGDSRCPMKTNYIGDSGCQIKTNYTCDSGCPMKTADTGDSECPKRMTTSGQIFNFPTVARMRLSSQSREKVSIVSAF